MEELQDAIEDVQYLQAVNSKDSGPSPTEPWPFPSEKALEEFNTESLLGDRQCYSLERICAGILGLYLVRAVASLATIDFAFDRIRNQVLSATLAFLLLLHNAQFGTFCSEMRELNKFEFILDVIRYRVRNYDLSVELNLSYYVYVPGTGSYLTFVGLAIPGICPVLRRSPTSIIIALMRSGYL